MSNDRELTEGDYLDAALRYHDASPAGEKERLEKAVEEAAHNLVKFQSGKIGKAAHMMLKESGRTISFVLSKDGEEGRYEYGVDDIRMFREGKPGIPVSLIGIVNAWLLANPGSVPNGFLPWLNSKLRKIHDEAPGKKQGEGASEDDDDGTAGLESEG